MADAMGDRRVDGVFGDVALDTEVVVAFAVAGQGATLFLHFVRRLPGAEDDFADAAHGLAVGADHRERSEVMEDVFGGDGFAADTAFGERHVFGDARVQVVTDHQHVQVFVDGVAGERSCRIGGAGQHVRETTGLDDVRRMTAAGAFGVVGVDGAPLEGAQGGFHEAGLVEGVGVDRHLHVVLVGHVQAVVDGCRGGAPVFVQLQADCTGLDLLDQWLRQACVTLAGEADVHRESVGGLEHARQVPWAGGAGGGVGPGRRASAAADHGGDAAHQGLFDLLRTDEVDVGVDAAGREDHAFAGNHFGAGADGDGHIGLDVRVAGLADGRDAPVLEADVGLDDAPVVDDQRVGDQRVHHLRGQQLALAHAVANHLAAAKLHFFTVGGEILFHFDPQLGIGQADLVTDGGAEHVGVGLSRDLHVLALEFNVGI